MGRYVVCAPSRAEVGGCPGSRLQEIIQSDADTTRARLVASCPECPRPLLAWTSRSSRSSEPSSLLSGTGPGSSRLRCRVSPVFCERRARKKSWKRYKPCWRRARRREGESSRLGNERERRRMGHFAVPPPRRACHPEAMREANELKICRLLGGDEKAGWDTPSSEHRRRRNSGARGRGRNSGRRALVGTAIISAMTLSRGERAQSDAVLPLAGRVCSSQTLARGRRAVAR